MSDLKDFTVINDVRLVLKVKARDANHAARKARDTSLDVWQISEHDELEVYDANGDVDDSWSWEAIEELWGR